MTNTNNTNGPKFQPPLDTRVHLRPYGGTADRLSKQVDAPRGHGVR